jgi:hypothetical protein
MVVIDRGFASRGDAALMELGRRFQRWHERAGMNAKPVAFLG